MKEIAQGPRPTLEETALDDLKFLLEIAQRHERGSYRASGTIADLKRVVQRQTEMADCALKALGLSHGDTFFWEATRLAKNGHDIADIRQLKDEHARGLCSDFAGDNILSRSWASRP